MEGLIIIGAGGFGREVLAWARQSAPFRRDWEIKGFIDDNPRALETKGASAPILGTIRDYEPVAGDVFICGIGQPKLRRKYQSQFLARSGRFVNVIHSTVVLADNVELGQGIVLCPQVVISANTRIDDGVAINLHSTVNHDSRIGAWTQINCHCDITGGVVLEEEVFVGSHASVLPGVRVGKGATIGAGSIVLEDVAPGTTVVGIPARALVRVGTRGAD
jgi:sugar O-acyltransferase (sialic acid O-acetyltransferase NeuD family)